MYAVFDTDIRNIRECCSLFNSLFDEQKLFQCIEMDIQISNNMKT